MSPVARTFARAPSPSHPLVTPPSSSSPSRRDMDRSHSSSLSIDRVTPAHSGTGERHVYPLDADATSSADAERGGLLHRWNVSNADVARPRVDEGWSDEEGEDEDDEDGSRGKDAGDSSPLIRERVERERSETLTRLVSSDSAPSQRLHVDDSARSRRRKVYGGGRQDEGGDMEVWEVALGIASDMLSPSALLIPHAFLLLGLPLGLPLLFVTATLAWFSHVVLVVCGRYVGGRTYAQIASAVFPDQCKGFNVWFGETGVELWRSFVSAGRGMVTMMIVSDTFAQLTRQYTPQAGILYSRVFIIVLVGVLSLVPKFILPRRPIFLPAAFPTLSRLPLYMTLLWPIAMTVIGVRLRQLNREMGHKLPPSNEGDIYHEIMGNYVWGGFAILLFCLTSPQNTFTHLRSLRRIRPTSMQSGSAPTTGLLLSRYTVRRYSWESAAFLGVLYATLVCMGWGLVGYLGMNHGGYEVNFLTALPSDDVWISTARVLILIVMIPSVPLSLRAATTAVFHLCRIPFIIHTASARQRRLRKRASTTSSHHSRREDHEREVDTEWDDEDEDESLTGLKAWGARLVTAFVWIGVAIGAILLGGSNGGEGSTVEVLGCVGSTILAGILPATFFVVLFHIRKARSIVAVNDPRSPLMNDNLLLRKETQLQRRLSGRRLWQDVGVFGLLLPYAIVVLLKGSISALQSSKAIVEPN